MVYTPELKPENGKKVKNNSTMKLIGEGFVNSRSW